jgi:hypothetical protein
MRLDALVRLAIDAGEQDSLTRSEMIAALVLVAPADGEQLATLLRTYRKAKVGDALVGANASGSDDSNVVTLTDRKPGRR